jgi:hypothetical protein
MSEVPEEVKDMVAEILRVFRNFPYVKVKFKTVERTDGQCRITGEYECFDLSKLKPPEVGSFEAEFNLGVKPEVVRFIVDGKAVSEEELLFKLISQVIKCPICGRENRFWKEAWYFEFPDCGHVLRLDAEDMPKAIQLLKEHGLVKEVKKP